MGIDGIICDCEDVPNIVPSCPHLPEQSGNLVLCDSPLGGVFQ